MKTLQVVRCDGCYALIEPERQEFTEMSFCGIQHRKTKPKAEFRAESVAFCSKGCFQEFLENKIDAAESEADKLAAVNSQPVGEPACAPEAYVQGGAS